MKPLNYCRQVTAVLQESLVDAIPERVEHYSLLLRTLRLAEKFSLPDGGSFLVDPDLRALDETMPLRLPYPITALEYPVSDVDAKRVLLAVQQDTGIFFSTFFWEGKNHRRWGLSPFTATIPNADYLRRGSGGLEISMNVSYDGDLEESLYPRAEAARILQLLNMLACANVRTEKVSQKQSSKKDALPFDSYRVLLIEQRQPAKAGPSTGGTHRSPREHLRRGHIRRYESGLKVWVNAAVVNAGVGGLVTKDYAVKDNSPKFPPHRPESRTNP